MGPGKSFSECQMKQMPLEAPSVDLQLEGMQSANKAPVMSVMMSLQRHFSEYLTMPLKDTTRAVDYLG